MPADRLDTAARTGAHHSHPNLWPMVLALPYDRCNCEVGPDTAFPVAVLNPLDPEQRAIVLTTLLDDCVDAAAALAAYNAVLTALVTPQPVENPVDDRG